MFINFQQFICFFAEITIRRASSSSALALESLLKKSLVIALSYEYHCCV